MAMFEICLQMFLLHLWFCLCPRHCVTGLGFTSGSPSGPQAGEEDDNSLSPEACYECKINGYPKKGRKRRSANSTQDDPVEDVQVICLYAVHHMF